MTELVDDALTRSTSKTIAPIAATFNDLSDSEKQDFLNRIQILDSSPRIDNIPEVIIANHMRCIRHEHREPVFERLEGWWIDAVIKQLTSARPEESSAKMSRISSTTLMRDIKQIICLSPFKEKAQHRDQR